MSGDSPRPLRTLPVRNPGGVAAQWVPLYESNEPAVRCEVATIVHCFPGTSLWSSQGRTIGYDVVALATKDGAAIVPLILHDALRRNGALAQSLRELGLGAADALQRSFVADASDLADWAQGTPLNRDANLRLQYLAGLGLNKYEQAQIYSEILAHRQIPENLFTGDPARLEQLRNAILARY